jgi:predicted ATPase
MQFFLARRQFTAPAAAAVPYAVLQHDPWSDFGYQTTFQLTLHMSRTRQVGIGEVKIAREGQPKGPTRLPSGEFSELPVEYCSLGVSIKYYTALLEEGRRVFDEVLSALRDATRDPQIAAAFERDRAFRTSLLRTGGAQRAFEDVPRLLSEQPFPTYSEMTLRFHSRVGGAGFDIDLDFNTVPGLPGRINVLIGYNGSGKTRLLANLAAVANESGERRNTASIRNSRGYFVDRQPAFGAVITVSYNAFDTFELPGRTDAEKKRLEERGEIFGFVYCGLRLRGGSDDPKAPELLKGAEAIARDFVTALEEIRRSKRISSLESALQPLCDEPSLGLLDLRGVVRGGIRGLEAFFRRASAGHKVVLNIIVQLAAHLQNQALVLVDEPETHLHPPLLAAFLRGLRTLLDEHDSFCVMATHSPVVLQETPRRFVRVLRRGGKATGVVRLYHETFAENLGLITREVFNLNSSSTDYHDILDRLQSSHSLEAIEGLFDGRLSSQGRTYLMSRVSEEE